MLARETVLAFERSHRQSMTASFARSSGEESSLASYVRIDEKHEDHSGHRQVVDNTDQSFISEEELSAIEQLKLQISGFI